MIESLSNVVYYVFGFSHHYGADVYLPSNALAFLCFIVLLVSIIAIPFGLVYKYFRG